MLTHDICKLPTWRTWHMCTIYCTCSDTTIRINVSRLVKVVTDTMYYIVCLFTACCQATYTWFRVEVAMQVSQSEGGWSINSVVYQPLATLQHRPLKLTVPVSLDENTATDWWSGGSELGYIDKNKYVLHPPWTWRTGYVSDIHVPNYQLGRRTAYCAALRVVWCSLKKDTITYSSLPSSAPIALRDSTWQIQCVTLFYYLLLVT